MNDNVTAALKQFIQVVEATERIKQSVNQISSNLFSTFFDVIGQFLFFILSLLPFLCGIIFVSILTWRTISYFLCLFDQLDASLEEIPELKRQVYTQVHETEKLDFETERMHWKNRMDQLVHARDYYQEEFEKLAAQLATVSKQPSGNIKEPVAPIEIEVAVPDKELSRALYKSDMKTQLKTILSAVEAVKAETIYQEALEEFAYELFVMQVRYALPYKIIMRLFEMYNEEELKAFYQSFSILMKALSIRKYKKIYRNSFYTSEQKMQLFDQDGLLEQLGQEFSHFLFYLLTKYSYRQVRELYQHFQKVWGIRNYQGIVQILLPSEAEIDPFKRLWRQTLAKSQLEFVVQAEVKKGVVIQSAQVTVDLSYQQLMNQFIDQYEVEVSI